MYHRRICQLRKDHSFRSSIGSFVPLWFCSFPWCSRKCPDIFGYAIQLKFFQKSRSWYQTICKLRHEFYDNDRKFILESFSLTRPLLMWQYRTHQYHRHTRHWSPEVSWNGHKHQRKARIQWCYPNEERYWRKEELRWWGCFIGLLAEFFCWQQRGFYGFGIAWVIIPEFVIMAWGLFPCLWVFLTFFSFI